MRSPAEVIHDKHEETLLEQGRRIRALHEIITRPDLTFEQQIDETLRLGCQLLGTEIGKVGRQDTEKNTSEFLNTVVMTDLPARRGIVLPLDKTFCQVTFSSPHTFAISHVADSEYSTHPAAKFLGMQSYIGCTIHVHGKKFGTVNFSNRSPVTKPFTEADKDLVNLIGSWVSVMMERQLEAEELRKSQEAAIAANLAKSSFLANMSHEIRTPLTSILGYAETALDDDQNMEQRLDALRIIKTSGDHLLNLINDVLDFSKIEAGELDIDNSVISPFQLITDVESIILPQAKKKGLDFDIEYHFPLPETIISDPLRLKQILLNLSGNAIKFTDAGSVKIKMQYDKDHDELQFIIEDTGIGMTSEQMDKLFQPFKQADAGISRRFGGTGLGLCLSKRLAELLNSRLEAISTYRKGSTFTLAMAYVKTGGDSNRFIHSIDEISRKQVSADNVLKVAQVQGKILLAEDNFMNQQLITRMLEKTGADVTVAENGAVAVQLAQETRFDLIFMDMQMPVMSGLDAVYILREINYHGPIVMLTANATMEDRTVCNEVGCNDFLTKPINRQHLYDIIKKYLTR